MALALYRRYRPDTFDKVIGQDQVTVPLMRALDGGRLTHAYLFSGPRGCGKTSSARIMARCINCEKGPTSHPCGECDSCRDLSSTGGGSIDVMEIDAASHNGVEDARQLRDSVLNPPVRDRYKIIILDEAHMVTPQGFNALLKTVEEPPERVMFIFATTEPEKVIGTIRSRTHHYPFRLVPPEIMGPYLERVCAQEHMEPEPGVLKLAMRAGGGSVRDTLSVLDQLMTGAADGRITYASATALLGFTPDAMISDALDAVIDRDGAKLYDVVEKVAVGGYEPRRFVEDLLARVRDLLVLSLAGQKAESVLSDTAEAEDLDDLKRQAGALGLGRLNLIAGKVDATLSTMAGAISPRMRLELLAASLLTEEQPAAMAGHAQDAAAGRSGQGNGAQTPGQGAPSAPRVGFIGAKRRAASDGASQRAVAERQGAPAGQRPDAIMTGVPGTGVEPMREAAPASGNAVGQTPGWSDAPRDSQPGQVAAHAGAPSQQRATSSSAPVPTPSAQPVPSADPAASAPDAHGRHDTRTVEERWQAVLDTLSERSREYVDHAHVARVELREIPDGKRPGHLDYRVALTFVTALAQHAFALAVDDETGVKLSHVVIKAVRREFGAQYSIAPSGVAANGEKVEPVTTMPAARQAEIKRQIALEASKRIMGKAVAGSAVGASAPVPAQRLAKEPATGAGSTEASPSHDPNGDGSSSGDDTEADPWLSDAPSSPARPTAPSRPVSADRSADHDAGSGPAVATEELGGPAHPALTVEIPDGVDPWAMDSNGVTPGNAGVAGKSGGGAMQAVSPAMPQSTSAASAVAASGDDVWGTGSGSPVAGGPSLAGTFPRQVGARGIAAHSGMPSALPEPDPDDAWEGPHPQRAFPAGDAGGSPPFGHPSGGPFVAPDGMGTQNDMSAASFPNDDADIDDENAYSMSDASIGDGQVDLETVKQMFDVKQVTVVHPNGDDSQ